MGIFEERTKNSQIGILKGIVINTPFVGYQLLHTYVHALQSFPACTKLLNVDLLV